MHIYKNILQMACKSGKLYLIEYLIPICKDSKYLDGQKLKEILDLTKDDDKQESSLFFVRERTLLYCACLSGNQNLVEYLFNLYDKDELEFVLSKDKEIFF